MTPLECNSETGITVGLIDGLMTISHVLVDRDLSSPEVGEALKDLRSWDDMHRLMDIGDLQSAKLYIEDQRKTIGVLVDALGLTNSLHEKQKSKTADFIKWIDEDIHDGKNLLQSARTDEERTHIASAVSTLHDVKEKFLTIQFPSS